MFFDTKKGELKPRKGIEIKVPRRSRVEISISRTTEKGSETASIPVLRDEKAQGLAGHTVELTFGRMPLVNLCKYLSRSFCTAVD